MPTQQAAQAALGSYRPDGWTTRLVNALLGTDSLQRRTLALLGLAALVTATVVVLLVYLRRRNRAVGDEVLTDEESSRAAALLKENET